ncbi:MAG: Gfo/Idh/MocA family oxidoreductase [bacterium]|nr:Gfo/Idh/MocA family oxidoreductase [bacterium]
MPAISRRQLIQGSTLAATAGLLPRQAPAVQDRKPSYEINVAVIGTGGRGGSHISGFAGVEGARVSVLCDADSNASGSRAQALSDKVDYKVETVNDFRRVLDRKDIDVITIATPNHWHALMTILACQAGKHVYVEKPVCHTIWEGRQMVNAQKKYKRVVSAGFQNRSDVALREAIPQIHEGRIGKIVQARGLCYRNRKTIGKLEKPLTPPATVDYNLWLGPAADLPIMRPKFHYDWHWVFNTGNGDMGNQGPHEMDLLRWALGDPQHPRKVTSFGERFAWNDAGDTPNLQYAQFDFGDGVPVIFEVRNLYQDGDKANVGKYAKGPGVGIIVTGEKGEFRGGRGGGAFYDNDGNKVEEFKGDSGRTHMEHFLECVRSGKQEDLRSPVESAYYSSCMSHLANISVRTGEALPGAALAERINNNAVASEVLGRFTEQLELWDVDTEKTPWNAGPELTFDPESEVFTAGEQMDAANGLVRRKDREPFVVPEIQV